MSTGFNRSGSSEPAIDAKRPPSAFKGISQSNPLKSFRLRSRSRGPSSRPDDHVGRDGGDPTVGFGYASTARNQVLAKADCIEKERGRSNRVMRGTGRADASDVHYTSRKTQSSSVGQGHDPSSNEKKTQSSSQDPSSNETHQSDLSFLKRITTKLRSRSRPGQTHVRTNSYDKPLPGPPLPNGFASREQALRERGLLPPAMRGSALPSAFTSKESRDQALRERGLLPPTDRIRPKRDLSEQEKARDRAVAILRPLGDVEPGLENGKSAARLIQEEYEARERAAAEAAHILPDVPGVSGSADGAPSIPSTPPSPPVCPPLPLENRNSIQSRQMKHLSTTSSNLPSLTLSSSGSPSGSSELQSPTATDEEQVEIRCRDSPVEEFRRPRSVRSEGKSERRMSLGMFGKKKRSSSVASDGLSVKGSFTNLRNALSGANKTPNGPPPSSFVVPRSRPPTVSSPSRPVSAHGSASTQESPSARTGCGVGLRRPLNPTMHNRESIVMEMKGLEDAESRRLSEMAFLD